jgi:hypothetical protein
MTTNTKPLPPPANGKKPAGPPTEQNDQAREFAIISGKIDSPERIVIYGPGGIGKSTLAALAPNPVFLDIEQGTHNLDVPRVEGMETFADVRAVLQSNALDGYDTIVLDSATRAEEMAAAHTLAHVKNEKGATVKNLEAYGFGKGYQHLYDTFLLLLADLDRQVQRGRNVILIAHDCVTEVPNPTGDDWIRYEPHLQSPKKGKGSIRNRVVQWAEHVLFVGYDVATDGGKGRGAGTRTIYTYELPSHVAKSRTIREALPFTNATDDGIWSRIFGGETNE